MTSATEGVLGPGSAPQAPGRVKAFLRLVMIEHSVFALPFAYIASLTAMFRLDRTMHWTELLLVTVCMVGLRTFAMAANRIIDREIDARNPRTAGRELVTGAVSVRSAWTGAGIALAVFLGSAALLNPLCLALAPIAVIPMVVYPYGKRFTNFPHAILGLAQAMGPVGAWLAVTGSWSWDAVILGLAASSRSRPASASRQPCGAPAGRTSSRRPCWRGTRWRRTRACCSGAGWWSSWRPSSTSTPSSPRTICPA